MRPYTVKVFFFPLPAENKHPQLSQLPFIRLVLQTCWASHSWPTDPAWTGKASSASHGAYSSHSLQFLQLQCCLPIHSLQVLAFLHSWFLQVKYLVLKKCSFSLGFKMHHLWTTETLRIEATYNCCTNFCQNDTRWQSFAYQAKASSKFLGKK